MLPTTDAAYCPTPPPRRRRRRSPIIAAVAAGALAITGLAVAPAYAHTEVSLPGSNFEIEPDANLKVDDASAVDRLGERRREPEAGPPDRRH